MAFSKDSVVLVIRQWYKRITKRRWSMYLKRILLLVALSFIVLPVSTNAALKTYACYYDLSRDQDTEITIMNLGTGTASYTLRVFDQSGDQIYVTNRMLSAGESDFFRLGQEIGHGPYYWGVVIIETQEDNFLSLAAEYYMDQEIVSIDNIIEHVPFRSSGRDYWYCIYHVNVGVSSTGLIVMNPWWEPTTVTVYVRDESGDVIYQDRITLSDHEADYLDLEDLIGQSPYTWGLIDIKADIPIVLACEYYYRGGSALEIDNVVDFYAWQED
jgi:hypothetical protein